MENRTEISTLGEFGLIDHLTENNEIKNASTIVTVGDDAAVIDHFGKQTVITTDLLTRHEYSPYQPHIIATNEKIHDELIKWVNDEM